MTSNNSSGNNEMDDAKEAGKDAEETVVFTVEPAGNQSVKLSVQEVQKDAAMEDAEIANPHNDMDPTAAPLVPAFVAFKVEDPTPPNLDANAKSIGTLPNNQLSVEPTSDSKAFLRTDIQSSANGVLDGTISIGFKSEDNDHQVVDGNNVCLDAKQPSNTKSEQNENFSETKAEGHQSKDFSCKGKELKGVIPLNEKSSDTNAIDDEKGEELKDLRPLNDKSSETKAKDDEKDDKLKELHLSHNKSSETKAEDSTKREDVKDGVSEMDLSTHSEIKKEEPKHRLDVVNEVAVNTANKSFLFEHSSDEGYESGTEEEQAEFMKQVETFYRENNFEFKAPKFYKEELNLLKLWRAVIKLGGYEQVTSCKLWRQVGESFRPPKTCTTVSWTFRIFYEKALLEYEKHKIRSGKLSISDGLTESIVRAEDQVGGSQALGSGRRRRDAATRAMEGWHSQRLLGNGQVCHPIIKVSGELCSTVYMITLLRFSDFNLPHWSCILVLNILMLQGIARLYNCCFWFRIRA
uniref:Transcription factor n=1 Tax=Rhizophora mucronata TaxID=61149 RepID=A0A2P2KAR4_RHIMU